MNWNGFWKLAGMFAVAYLVLLACLAVVGE